MQFEDEWMELEKIPPDRCKSGQEKTFTYIWMLAVMSLISKFTIYTFTKISGKVRD